MHACMGTNTCIYLFIFYISIYTYINTYMHKYMHAILDLFFNLQVHAFFHLLYTVHACSTQHAGIQNIQELKHTHICIHCRIARWLVSQDSVVRQQNYASQHPNVAPVAIGAGYTEGEHPTPQRQHVEVCTCVCVHTFALVHTHTMHICTHACMHACITFHNSNACLSIHSTTHHHTSQCYHATFTCIHVHVYLHSSCTYTQELMDMRLNSCHLLMSQAMHQQSHVHAHIYKHATSTFTCRSGM